MKQSNIDKIAEILWAARTDDQVRLRYASRIRANIRERLSRGDETVVSHYRYLWLKETRDAIINILDSSREIFANQHPYDQISIQDYFDVLTATSNIIKEVADGTLKRQQTAQ